MKIALNRIFKVLGDTTYKLAPAGTSDPSTSSETEENEEKKGPKVRPPTIRCMK